MRRFARLSVLVLVIGAGLGAAEGAAQHPVRSTPTDSSTPLAVPYLPQTVLLCGGAALAMLERWWGRRGVYAEEFASLVRPELGGILTTALDSAASARGWASRAIRGTPELTRQLLQGGVPVIALLEVARDRYHYVVVLSWDADGVTFHDPAVSPSMRLSEAAFVSRWAGSEHWALVVQPSSPGPPAPAPASPPQVSAPAVIDSLPCRPWLDRALDAVAADQLEAAAGLLEQAAQACPAESRVQREMAGVRFKQGRHAETIQLTSRYLVGEPDDALAWQLLATSRYLTGDLAGALEAWNRLDRPTVDLVVINGSRSVRHGQLTTALDIPHGTILTPAHLALARRRLQDIPALRSAAVSYRAVPGGVVEVHAAVAERQAVAPAWRLAASNLAGALTQQTVALEANSLTGAGELWAAEWRWERARPLASLRVEIPAKLRVPGVVSLEGAREGMRVATDAAALTVVEDTWRSVRLGFGAWLSTAVRPTMAVGFERWSNGRSWVTLSSGAELWTRGDRLRFTVSGTHAAAVRDHPSWRRGGARVMWASSLGLNQAAWSARLGGDWTSANTPLGAWPVAGGNLSRAIPLRAEPSPLADVLSGRAAGRSILHGGVAGDLPVYRVGPFIFAVGAFLDGARVASSADASLGDRFYLDGGVGLRLGVAGGELGVLRLDLARGLLTDRRSAVTAGMHLSWPVFPQASR